MNYMNNKTKRIFCVIIALALCLCTAACGGDSSDRVRPSPTPDPTKPVEFAAGSVEPDTVSLTLTLQDGETELLNRLTALKSADLSGSACVEEIFNWANAHPSVDVRYTVPLPDGSTAASSLTELDLSHSSAADISAYADCVRWLPELSLIRLGEQRTGITWELIETVRAAAPQADIQYSFELYGQSVDLSDSTLNLSHIPVEDNADAVIEALRHMNKVTYLDMDSCGVPDERMAEIRELFPNIKVVWRIWFGANYSVRTDVERILASSPSVGGMLDPENSKGLKYCTDVKYLDVGHNDDLTDISFVAYMPKLEVAILAMNNWSDASPLANCHELEYLEIQTTLCTDLTPLSGLTKLRHLNIAYNRDLSDISPLYSLTELERLWIGCLNPVPAEQVEEMQRCAPNCEINVEVYIDPTGGRWRYVDYNELAYMYIYHPRYIELREQFGDYAQTAYSYTWNDPLY